MATLSQENDWTVWMRAAMTGDAGAYRELLVSANLYRVAQDEVVAFDFATGECRGVVVRLTRLHGQALVFFH